MKPYFCNNLMFRFCIAISFIVLSSGMGVCVFAAAPKPATEKTEPKPVAAKKTDTATARTESGSSNEFELSGKDFVTKDGVQLTGTYYIGQADKDTVPVVLLHGQGRDRTEFDSLIPELQKHGYAILVPDFRGHGKSIKRMPQPALRGQTGMMAGPVTNAPRTKPIDYLVSDFERKDFEDMIKFDLEPFDKFLVKGNNAEKLNLNKLVIVGIDMGGTLGAAWAGKRTKNTKSLIIVSPNFDSVIRGFVKGRKSFLDPDMTQVCILVGETDMESKANADELKNEILGKVKDDEFSTYESKVPLFVFPTDKHGGGMLSTEKLEIPQKICEYIEYRFSKFKPKDLPWKKQ